MSFVRIEVSIVGEFVDSCEDVEGFSPPFEVCSSIITLDSFPFALYWLIINLENRFERSREAMLSCARVSIIVRRKEDMPPPITINANEFTVDDE